MALSARVALSKHSRPRVERHRYVYISLNYCLSIGAIYIVIRANQRRVYILLIRCANIKS